MPRRPDDCAAVLPLLEAYLDGELLPTEAEGVREHVERCPDCAAEARLALAYVGQVSRRAGLALKDEVLPERLLAPAARGLSRSLQIPETEALPSAPRQGS